MALMYPNIPKDFAKNSMEDIMFNALSNLSDNYYVFHSFNIVNVLNNVIHESETDFVIFHPKKGILVLEAKAGNVKYEEGFWKYGSDIIMKHGGPFNQAARNKFKLIDYFKDKDLDWLLQKCKIIHAVWFPSITKEHFKGVSLPPEADHNLILTKESLTNIENDISKIFTLDVEIQKETNLNKEEEDIIVKKVLAPSFNLISLSTLELEHNREVFKLLLKEQIALLNYLEEQNTAVINGMAGTGKTVMAVEKAKRHAEKNEKVLFLCYNKYLKEYLETANYIDNVSYYTLDGYACKLCHTDTSNYNLLKEKLLEYYLENNFPYKHIIIDEGQDFGRINESECEIIEILKSNVLDDETKKGTFYIFYDKNQLIQSNKLPKYISEADCKLTLYKNCRNTENIATTSLRILNSGLQPKLYEGAIIGNLSEMYISNTENINETLNKVIAEYIEKGYKDIVILTCKTEETSIIKNKITEGFYKFEKKQIKFTTCRKFKGLEADAIILIDITKEMFNSEKNQIMYVGSSRARFMLSLLLNINIDECKQILENLEIKPGKNPYKSLGTYLNSKYKEIL